MDITIIDAYMIPTIVIGCLCIGYVMKKWLPTDDKWIPTVLLIIGAICGVIVFGVDFEGIVKGMVSGLASVGLHQAFYQHMKFNQMGKDELYAMGRGDDEFEGQEIYPDVYDDYFDDEEIEEEETEEIEDESVNEEI